MGAVRGSGESPALPSDLMPSHSVSAAQPRHLTVGLLTVITPNLFFKSLINSKSFSIFNPLNHSCFSIQGRDVVGGLGALCTAVGTPAPG